MLTFSCSIIEKFAYNYLLQIFKKSINNCILLLNTESQCTRGDLRLVGGSGSYEGNVQICIDDEWGWVCDNSWDFYDAEVVCRQLGFSISSLYMH